MSSYVLTMILIHNWIDLQIVSAAFYLPFITCSPLQPSWVSCLMDYYRNISISQSWAFMSLSLYCCLEMITWCVFDCQVQPLSNTFHFLLQTRHTARTKWMENGITLMTAVCRLQLRIRLWWGYYAFRFIILCRLKKRSTVVHEFPRAVVVQYGNWQLLVCKLTQLSFCCFCLHRLKPPMCYFINAEMRTPPPNPPPPHH